MSEWGERDFGHWPIFHHIEHSRELAATKILRLIMSDAIREHRKSPRSSCREHCMLSLTDAVCPYLQYVLSGRPPARYVSIERFLKRGMWLTLVVLSALRLHHGL